MQLSDEQSNLVDCITEGMTGRSFLTLTSQAILGSNGCIIISLSVLRVCVKHLKIGKFEIEN